MADCFPGEIKIGGGVPAPLLDEFLREVVSTGASVGGYDGAASDRLDAEGLRQALDGKGHLHLADAEARFGQFEEIEDFCVRHGIPFDRHSDAKEYDSENVRFRPGMEHPVVVSSDNAVVTSWTPTGSARSPGAWLAWRAAGRPKDKLLAAVRKATRKLDGLLPPEVNPLPPLEITDDSGMTRNPGGSWGHEMARRHPKSRHEGLRPTRIGSASDRESCGLPRGKGRGTSWEKRARFASQDAAERLRPADHVHGEN